ncbi:glutathione S-transferase A-like [Saccostrea cucullata]|uniref:glutathione S-transferase A-like n=1 Tax=Saccostrea cuccullata TaxID=36930 RepID=UPI002ED126A6
MATNMFLYWGSGSIPCWKAMIVLEEKGFGGYKNKLIEFSKQEHKGPDVLKLNPRGQMPVFKDGDIVVNESSAICEYLESTYKDKGNQLIPSDKAKRATVLQRMHEASNNFQQKLMVDLLFYFFQTKEEDRKPEDLKKKGEALKEELQRWEGYIEKTKGFVADSNFTMADVYFYPFLAFGKRWGLELEKFPNLKAYYDKMSARPSVKSTEPPHWKEEPPKATPLKGIF